MRRSRYIASKPQLLRQHNLSVVKCSIYWNGVFSPNYGRNIDRSKILKPSPSRFNPSNTCIEHAAQSLHRQQATASSSTQLKRGKNTTYIEMAYFHRLLTDQRYLDQFHQDLFRPIHVGNMWGSRCTACGPCFFRQYVTIVCKSVLVGSFGWFVGTISTN